MIKTKDWIRTKIHQASYPSRPSNHSNHSNLDKSVHSSSVSWAPCSITDGNVHTTLKYINPEAGDLISAYLDNDLKYSFVFLGWKEYDHETMIFRPYMIYFERKIISRNDSPFFGRKYLIQAKTKI